MVKGKKQEDATEEVNTLMEQYRVSVLPQPILMWRTEGKTVAALELTDADFERIRFILGIDDE